MAEQLLDDFPVSLTWPVAWGDMDAFGHVNNVTYFRWFESVRIHFFATIGWASALTEGGVLPILGYTACTYRVPLTFPDTVFLGARAESVADDRFTMRYRVVSERLGVVAAEGEGRIVAFDYGAGRKARLPDSVRAAIVDLHEG
jgi:acyl-CoA thioester hydrolase